MSMIRKEIALLNDIQLAEAKSEYEARPSPLQHRTPDFLGPHSWVAPPFLLPLAGC